MRESLQKKEDEFKVRAPNLPPLTLSVDYTHGKEHSVCSWMQF
jgi:hypothetical protein